jgi:tetratricopeptide (TPR) repeat protein
MSVGSLECPKCQQECRFDGLLPFPPSRQDTYGVAWKCPRCGHRSLDVCNLGPLVPSSQSCLNCGADHQPGQDPCPGCGLSALETRSFLRLSDTPPAEAARVADEAFRHGWFRHGIGILNQVLQQDRGATEAWDLKYRFLQALGFHQASEEMLKQALAAGGPVVLLVRYGGLLAARGAFSEAVAVFQDFLDRGSPDPHTAAIVSSEQGVALAALGNFAASQQAHQRAIAAMPAAAALYQNYADLFIKQRNWDEAVRTLDVGLGHARTAADRIGLLEAKGHVLCGQMRGEDALACLDEAVGLGSNSVKTHFIRGRALAMLGRLDEARAAMQQVLRLDPGMVHAQQALQQIEAALRD